MPRKKSYESQKEVLMQEVRSVLNELEGLYESAKDDGSENIEDFKSTLQQKLGLAKSKLSELEERATEQVRHAAHQTDELVREQPYYAMGVAALAGVVLGALLCRR